jgi:GntR family transcriptional regulator, transcriptional repressor for pyruvate dehydrogenase complex
MQTNTELTDLPAIDAVFDRLVIDIVQGTHPQGTRLPAERELAKRLGASRPTLREALRRLGAWNLIAPRRGSGILVRSYRDWSIEVVPAYLRHGKPVAGQPTVSRILLDILTLRRALMVEVMRQAADRVDAASVVTARAATERAWARRDAPVAHAREDLEVMRLLVEGAGFTPGLWALNRVATIWLELVQALGGLVRVPDDYVEAYTGFFDLLAEGRAAAACELLAANLRRRDEELLLALGLSEPLSAPRSESSAEPRSQPLSQPSGTAARLERGEERRI